jgi:homocysteine S-methyltransferase
MSHAELDEATELDDGDPSQLAVDQKPLLDTFKNLQVLGGCCGTDHRHIAAMWGVAQN